MNVGHASVPAEAKRDRHSAPRVPETCSGANQVPLRGPRGSTPDPVAANGSWQIGNLRSPAHGTPSSQTRTVIAYRHELIETAVEQYRKLGDTFGNERIGASSFQPFRDAVELKTLVCASALEGI